MFLCFFSYLISGYFVRATCVSVFLCVGVHVYMVMRACVSACVHVFISECVYSVYTDVDHSVCIRLCFCLCHCLLVHLLFCVFDVFAV